MVLDFRTVIHLQKASGLFDEKILDFAIQDGDEPKYDPEVL